MKKAYFVATAALTSLALMSATAANASGKRYGKHMMERGQQMFEAQDQNQNDEISLQEFEQFHLTNFQAMDVDGNQSVTEEEMANHFRARMQEMKERRKKWYSWYDDDDQDHWWKWNKGERTSEVTPSE